MDIKSYPYFLVVVMSFTLVGFLVSIACNWAFLLLSVTLSGIILLIFFQDHQESYIELRLKNTHGGWYYLFVS